MTNVKMKIRKGDKVIVITGKDKGQKGTVVRAYPTQSKVLVEGINLATVHVRPSPAFPEGGKVKRAKPIHVSNLAHLDPKLDMPTKVGYKYLGDGKKVRIARRSGELIDQ